jgi:hypothetical protein
LLFDTRVLDRIDETIKEVHPNRFIDPSECGFVKKRKLSQQNLLLGRDDSESFAAITFEDLLALTSDCERKDTRRSFAPSLLMTRS